MLAGMMNIPEMEREELVKKHEMAVKKSGLALAYVPEEFKTAKLCELAVRLDARALEFVPEHLKTRKMCSRAVSYKNDTIEFVPEKFQDYEMQMLAYELGFRAEPPLEKSVACLCGGLFGDGRFGEYECGCIEMIEDAMRR